MSRLPSPKVQKVQGTIALRGVGWPPLSVVAGRVQDIACNFVALGRVGRVGLARGDWASGLPQTR